MTSQEIAGGIATVIGAAVVTYMLFLGTRHSTPVITRAKEVVRPILASPAPATAVPASTKKGPVVRDLPSE
jgi:hypothetical protein